MSLNIFKTYASDLQREETGIEVQIGPDAYITVARANNKKYSRLLTQAFEANKFILNRKASGDSDVANDKAEEIIIDVMAKSILIGWRGIVDDKGAEVPYSYAAAKEALMIKDFRLDVSKHAEDFNNFRKVTEETDAKN
jgi:hypothetical protein